MLIFYVSPKKEKHVVPQEGVRSFNQGALEGIGVIPASAVVHNVLIKKFLKLLETQLEHSKKIELNTGPLLFTVAITFCSRGFAKI